MDDYGFHGLDSGRVTTPSFIVDTALIDRNLAVLSRVREEAGCKILLALKGFAMFSLFPRIAQSLDGICASGLFEARLGREEFGKDVHVFSPAFTEKDFKETAGYADYLIFNSLRQWQRFKDAVPARVKQGLRVNPEHSEISVDLYNPCARYSRLGMRSQDLMGQDISGISGLHFHALCEQNADVLERVLDVFEKKFGRYLPQMKWVNFGGGHHITRHDYDVGLLKDLVRSFRERYGVEVYLEPGEAVALNAGILVASVVDIVENEMSTAILDTSAETHMPDVLAMPYRPDIVGSGKPGEYRYTYRLGGPTCLTGDVIGDYSFPEPLDIGSKLVFLDMAHYSMVKTTMFNGINLPDIAVYDPSSRHLKTVRSFTYEDYKTRLS